MEREKTEIYSRNPYEGTDFPLLVLHVDQRRCEPENQGFLHTHWHEELQFVCQKRPGDFSGIWGALGNERGAGDVSEPALPASD